MKKHNTGDIEAMRREFEKFGARLCRETKKLDEFRMPRGQIVYLIKTSSSANAVRVVVHPNNSKTSLMKLPEIAPLREQHYFHSNMINFPKRLNGGKTECAYGWQLEILGLQSLPQFLQDADQILV